MGALITFWNNRGVIIITVIAPKIFIDVAIIIGITVTDKLAIRLFRITANHHQG